MTTDLFALLTTEPNYVVSSIHMKAIPVILTTPDEVETWLTARWEAAKALQRPLSHGVRWIVAVGGKGDAELPKTNCRLCKNPHLSEMMRGEQVS